MQKNRKIRKTFCPARQKETVIKKNKKNDQIKNAITSWGLHIFEPNILDKSVHDGRFFEILIVRFV